MTRNRLSFPTRFLISYCSVLSRRTSQCPTSCIAALTAREPDEQYCATPESLFVETSTLVSSPSQQSTTLKHSPASNTGHPRLQTSRTRSAIRKLRSLLIPFVLFSFHFIRSRYWKPGPTTSGDLLLSLLSQSSDSNKRQVSVAVDNFLQSSIID